MGVVYKARETALNRDVALKMIKSGGCATQAELVRIQNEAEAVATLDHPSIVPIYEVGQYRGRHFLSMKLVSGNSLDKRLADFHRRPTRNGPDRRHCCTGGSPRPPARDLAPRPETCQYPPRRS